MTIVTPASADTYGRHDTYRFIHKGLRMAQCQMLARLGQADFQGEEGAGLLAQLRTLLMLGASHIGHEETHIHVHLDSKDPVGIAELDTQHAAHRESFARLEALIRQVEAATPEQKAEAGHRLYLAYALFVAHDCEHMNEEETVNNDRLWRFFTDEQIIAMERAIVASLPPEKAAANLAIMLPALTRDERVRFLGAMKPAIPADAFAGMMEHVARPALTTNDYADLRTRLGMDLHQAA